MVEDEVAVFRRWSQCRNEKRLLAPLTFILFWLLGNPSRCVGLCPNMERGCDAGGITPPYKIHRCVSEAPEDLY